MADSENAKQVARDVVAAIVSGKKVDKTKIQIKNGYSRNSALTSRAIRTESYKKEFKWLSDPIIKQFERQRELALARMQETVSRAEYQHAVTAVDKMTHNIQLLGGEATERHAIIVIDEEVKKRYATPSPKGDSEG